MLFRPPYALRTASRPWGSRCSDGPLWFLNGVFYPNRPWGEEFDQISLAMLEGIEFYADPYLVPAEYWRAGSECGVIALWTRVSAD
jgi:hypothetical protein